MPIGPARMPIMEHLGELRMRIVRILVALVIAICVFYLATPTLGRVLLLPIADSIPGGIEQGLWALTPFEGFITRFQISVWASIIACSPLIIWQILAFFLPALRPNERKWFVPTFFAGVLLFIAGTVFCYFIILRPAFGWLTDQALGLGSTLPQMSSYIDMITKFEIGFGIAFELPLVVFYLVIFDIVPYKKMRAGWRYVYVVLVVLSAMITPDASPVTMILLACAMIALYEGSLLIARIVLRRRIKKQAAEMAEFEAEADEEQAIAEQQADSLRDRLVKRFGDKA